MRRTWPLSLSLYLSRTRLSQERDGIMRRSVGPRLSDRYHGRFRSQYRKWLPCRLSHLFLGVLAIAVVMFFGMLIWMLPGTGEWPGVWGGRQGGGRPLTVRFVPADLLRRFEDRGGLDRLRSEPRPGNIRRPRLALVAGIMNKDSQSLMLLTLVKSLRELGYIFTVFALQSGEAHSLWEHVGYQVSILSSDSSGSIDWSNYEGVIVSSLEAKSVISSLMQEPFCYIPVIWLVQEDILGERLTSYAALGHQHLITMWRTAFSRADVVVFPDLFLPMLYTPLDTGNFYAISGSPVDVWAAKSYIASYSRLSLTGGELTILVTGSYFLYDELPWDYAAVMNALYKQIISKKDLGVTMKFVILCGNSTDTHGSDFQELASRMGFPDGSVRHCCMDANVNSLLLLSDIVLYGSFLEEQSFPPVLVRAMSFEIPIIVPDLHIIKKYVVENVDAVFFNLNQPDSLARAFSLLVEDRKLSTLARAIASNAKILSKNMLASDCIADYAKLLEHVLQFPSDAMLPNSISDIQQKTWLWNLLEKETEQTSSDVQEEDFTNDDTEQGSIVDKLEEQFFDEAYIFNNTQGEIDPLTPDYPTQQDWNDVSEIEISEDIVRREMQEHEERKERNSGSWEDIYRNAKKAEKQNFDPTGRDESELERTGQPLCIYEIYNGEGSWPFLHHGSLYRGISVSKRAPKSRPDDVDAVGRLPILNDTYYRDLLCELGAMFSIANKVDSIHKIPWIGFQSWRAAGSKVSLSIRAENALEETIHVATKGDVLFYWALMDFDQDDKEKNRNLTFWSLCDSLNAGLCRDAFKKAFRQMYGLPYDVSALPPMPADGDEWSTLHSWVMPTPSFLEFMMFSRMFVDSLHSLHQNISGPTPCELGSSQLEKRHCYCRVLEVLVNVWAYHSARRMVYLNPGTGELKEQHPVEQRKGIMWAKYFNATLLKTMDEDLAEEADDGTHLTDPWLWPETGEVQWQGILDREREERYRRKMDKKRKTKEKLRERQKHGYKQKPIGTNRNQ